MSPAAAAALLVAVALLATAASAAPEPRVLEEDAYLSCPELITKYGYPVEQHEVTTEDGYILTVFRIPYGKTSTTKTANRKPVYVQHGLLSSSDDWILARPQRALVTN
ncbi:Lipase [Gryllus bimaculatus]|nr:Lipase [Gryllus bimaculatus]